MKKSKGKLKRQPKLVSDSCNWKTVIDWQFIHQHENKNNEESINGHKEGYLPSKDSGVTIATGLDLGHQIPI